MKWQKPNSTEIETNDLPATVAYCRSLGWEEVGASEPKVAEPASMKVEELRAALSDAGVEIPDDAKKADLVALLEGALNDPDEDPAE